MEIRKGKRRQTVFMNFYYVSGSMGFKTLRYQYCYFRMTEEDTNV